VTVARDSDEQVERLARRYRGRMTRGMVRDDLLPDPRWRAAFAEVPRHVFLPRFFRPVSPNTWAAVDATDRDWLTQVYANRVQVTQLDGDPTLWETARRQGEIRGVPTSSSSMPAIMAVMLEALSVTDGVRVLEIGTGTGYNAALLCHRLGATQVSTVDIDTELVSTAAARLSTLDYHPVSAAADGAAGYAPGAPYDRMISTCSVSEIPLAWLEQTVPGGIIVTTLNRPLGAGLLRITAGDGPHGTGRVLADDGRFMPLRAHRRTLDDAFIESLTDAPGQTRPTELSAATVVSPTSPFEFFAGLALPNVFAFTPAPKTVLLVHEDGSWARHHNHRVTQSGPRALWDEAEAAHELWLSLNRPRRPRFGITIDPTCQELWLDNPDSSHRWRLSDQG
jgi:methyltransferase of ATP-grasp peptide maturase system